MFFCGIDSVYIDFYYLGLKKIGDQVNIEIDMLGKWVKKILKKENDAGMTREQLTGTRVLMGA